MVEGDVGSFDTRYERLTGHYRELIERGQLKPGDRFPSARELSEKHGVGRTTSGRVHGTLISVGLIEHRPGVGTFVLAPPPTVARKLPGLQQLPGQSWMRSTHGQPGPSRRHWPVP